MGYRDKLRSILEIKETPHSIAMAFAIGVFWGMSPLLGIHTIGAFFMAWFMGLNRFVAVVGVYVTNPWTIVPIYTFSTWVGTKMMGMKQVFPDIDWGSVTFMSLMHELKELILPFFVGTFLIGAISAVLSYFIIRGIVARYRSSTPDVPGSARE
ncbi:MAG TPA: DUF2062 domain-containing protein [Nitrospirae bacterium]|nr:hypothetical protein BMS3Abin10_00974 [bacterium BMS3Abin10]GBE39203.1 hypothetical protein BMS3Bbin08_01824 [bacterium BMS3Bbin08]HDH50309.1 DUF2062 domain-containing protein [Nitrospirota bacterium]HDK17254.1 DUF2062 domain-containing protein [Nitrospirota bacterium]HDK41188.1 DUF2062 domain-containing protein [Nitrospirota bacterium]